MRGGFLIHVWRIEEHSETMGFDSSSLKNTFWEIISQSLTRETKIMENQFLCTGQVASETVQVARPVEGAFKR